MSDLSAVPEATTAAASAERASAETQGAVRDIVVIGASAGGVEALSELFAGLPAGVPAAFFVVLHVMPGGTSVLPRILERRGGMPVAAAADGEPIERGRVYVAPPDHHMLIRDGRVALTSGPRENGHRPAVDPLFRSAARAFGPRVIGVVLSGTLDDGSAGLGRISASGGLALVQDPSDALYPGMPASALAHVPGARTVTLADLARILCEEVAAAVADPADPPLRGVAKSVAVDEPDRSDDDPRKGSLTPLTCPECGGSLWEQEEDGVLRYKCHVGHAYSSESLHAGQGQAVENALWAALRGLEERADLLRRLARRMGGSRAMERRAAACDHHAEVLRSLLGEVAPQILPEVEQEA
jgi:two-component system chemotaxis response regulator CheB